MATYHVDFQPSGQSTNTPVVSATDAAGTSVLLPCLLQSGTYLITWVLQGNPGDSAPGLIVATNTNGAHSVPPTPIGWDLTTGQPEVIQAAAAAHDQIPNYTLP